MPRIPVSTDALVTAAATAGAVAIVVGAVGAGWLLVCAALGAALVSSTGAAWLLQRRRVTDLTGRSRKLLADGRCDAAFNEFRALKDDGRSAALGYRLAERFASAGRNDLAERTWRTLTERASRRADVARLRRREPTEVAKIPAGLPQMIGRYTIEGLLGRGAMGSVYLASDSRINRPVALKVVNLEREFDATGLDAARARFFQEAESAGRLHHPALATVYDAGEVGQLAYIAMEYVTGRPLADYRYGGEPIDTELLLELIARAAEALAYAHEQRVIHRDVKPSNILYDAPTDTVKIMDFGVAQLADAVRTQTGIILGTPVYMAPEQLLDEPLAGYSDLFSLGVTLYELLTGQLPFPVAKLADVAEAITNAEAPPLATRRPDLPACVQRVVDLALARKPAQRYQDGWTMADDLRRCLLDFRPELVSNSVSN